MRSVVVGGIIAVALVGGIFFAVTSGGDDEPIATAAVSPTMNSVAESSVQPDATEAPTAPSSTAVSTASATETTVSASCEPTLTPHVIADGWFDSLTAEPVMEAGLVGERFYYANTVRLEFPVAGGPAYFYGTAVWTSDVATSATSLLASADSRAADPLGSPSAPEHVLIYDAASALVDGTGTIAAAFEEKDFSATPVLGEPPWVSSGFAAQYDESAQRVTGSIAHPDGPFTFVADVLVEDRQLWPSAECYRQAQQTAAEADQP